MKGSVKKHFLQHEYGLVIALIMTVSSLVVSSIIIVAYVVDNQNPNLTTLIVVLLFMLYPLICGIWLAIKKGFNYVIIEGDTVFTKCAFSTKICEVGKISNIEIISHARWWQSIVITVYCRQTEESFEQQEVKIFMDNTTKKIAALHVILDDHYFK